MDTTPRLQLPYIMPSQAQKHVTHNEALRLLDGLVQAVVKGRDLTSPPAAPAEGDAYVAAGGATGAWAGHANAIACFQDGTWQFLAPAPGWQAYDAGAGERILFDGSAWASADAGGSRRPFFGINTDADATERLAVASSASLFTHEGGDHRLKVNKASAADTASHIFQTAYSGRAELGLAGDDDLHLKVSPDGESWHEALIAERASGGIRFPGGVLHAASGRPLVQLLPCPAVGQHLAHRRQPAGDAAQLHARLGRRRGGEAHGSARAGDLHRRHAGHGDGAHLERQQVAAPRPAWVRWNNSAAEVGVSDAADIASWAAGETLQLGDPNPTGANALNMVAIDISPFLRKIFGVVFPQKGVLLATCASGARRRRRHRRLRQRRGRFRHRQRLCAGRHAAIRGSRRSSPASLAGVRLEPVVSAGEPRLGQRGQPCFMGCRASMSERPSATGSAQARRGPKGLPAAREERTPRPQRPASDRDGRAEPRRKG